MRDGMTFKRRLFGLNTRKVSTYLRQLQHLQDREEREWEEQLEVLRKEQAQLLAERDRLAAQVTERQMEDGQKSFLLERAEGAVLALQRHGEEEIAALRELAEQKRQEQVRKRAHVEQQLHQYEQTLHGLLSEFEEVLQDLNLPDGSWSELERMERASVYRETASAAVDVAERAEAMSSTSTVTAEPSLFWGELTDSLVEGGSGESSSEMSADEVDQVFVQQGATDQDEPLVSEQDSHPVPTLSQESASLSGEIQSIRNRYLVGKRVGNDLYDTDGLLLAEKNAEITPDLVEEADRAGKLPELILHMTIPGALGDEASA
ncbi:MAG TPA: hypothetical protein VFV52_08745 [Bacilli bacterium]|nr:hypothetical protein [Bacilli bacterium]